jgi:spermidine/putrescine transport system permease protein
MPVDAGTTRKGRRSLLWPALALPGALWLALLFLAPLYVVLSIVFGGIDPIFRTPLPVWNPAKWNSAQFLDVFDHIFGSDGYFGPALLRTAAYVLLASCMCLLVAYPVAYYTARLSGRHRKVLLALLIAPFWISYMMRMLAWVNLLQNDGLVNRVLSLGGLADVSIDWLNGRSLVVVLGLVYGYIPYMILPLYAGLERVPRSLLEASADLGGRGAMTFRRITLPLVLPALAAGSIFTFSLTLGDYITPSLVSSNQFIGNVVFEQQGVAGNLPLAAAFAVVPVAIMGIYLAIARRLGAFEAL